MKSRGFRASLSGATVGVVSLLALLLGCAPAESARAETEVEILRPIMLTEVAHFPENDPALLGVKVEEGRLVFFYSSRADRTIAVGDVLSGVLGGGYLRRVLGTRRLDDGRIEAVTEKAQLGDLILDGHFRIRMTPEASHWQESSDVGTAAQALTSCPDGVSCLPDAQVSLLPDPTRKLPCAATASASVSVQPTFTASVRAVLEIDIRPQAQWLSFRQGALHRASLRVDGQALMGIDVGAQGGVSASCDIDLAGALHLPSLQFPTVLTLGPIVVPSVVFVTPKLGVEVKVDSQAAFSWSGNATFGFSAGVEYADGAWSPIWETISDWGVEKQEMSGSMEAAVKVSGGVEVSYALLGLVGPTAGVGFFIEETVQSDAQGCGYRVVGGLDGSVGVRAELKVNDLIDVTLFDVGYPFELVKRQLGSGPCLPCPPSAPTWNPDTMRCEACPAETPMWSPTLKACVGPCSGDTKAGGDAPVTRAFELGEKKGTFMLSHDRQTQKDQIVVKYEGKTLYDSGCGGDLDGTTTAPISYDGSSTQIIVEVHPNCAGGTGTEWSFSVGCPEPPSPPEWPETVIFVHGWAGLKDKDKESAKNEQGNPNSFWYWKGAAEVLKDEAKKDKAKNFLVKAANWDGVSALQDSMAHLERALDCYCTGSRTCDLVGHSTGDAVIGYTLDKASVNRTGAAQSSDPECKPSASSKGWNIKSIYVAGGVGGGSEVGPLGQTYNAASGLTEPIMAQFRPGVMRSLYNHDMHEPYTHVPNIRFVGGGQNTGGYAAGAWAVPGESDGIVPFHSQGGVSTYAVNAIGNAYCTTRRWLGSWSCGQLNLGVAPAEQWAYIHFVNVPLFAGYRIAMIDDARKYDHSDEVAHIAEWIVRYKRTKTPWYSSSPSP